MQFHIVIGSLHPIHFRQSQENDSATRFYRNPISLLGIGLQILEQRAQPLLHLASLITLDLLSRPLECRLESDQRTRLYEVIQGVNVKRAPSKIIIGRDKNYYGHALKRDLLQDREAIHLRHLYIEENQVGREQINR